MCRDDIIYDKNPLIEMLGAHRVAPRGLFSSNLPFQLHFALTICHYLLGPTFAPLGPTSDSPGPTWDPPGLPQTHWGLPQTHWGPPQTPGAHPQPHLRPSGTHLRPPRAHLRPKGLPQTHGAHLRPPGPISGTLNQSKIQAWAKTSNKIAWAQNRIARISSLFPI